MDEWKTGQKVPNLPAARHGVKNTRPLSRPLGYYLQHGSQRRKGIEVILS